jgi:hypothetical protein
VGCDIHLFVEFQTQEGEWKLAPNQLAACDNCKGSGLDPELAHCKNCHKDGTAHEAKTQKCYFSPGHYESVHKPCSYNCLRGQSLHQHYYYTGGRNYSLFGILSGVRGDADPAWTIEDSGLPEDATEYVKHDSASMGYHSEGSYSLAYLLTYDWKQKPLTGLFAGEDIYAGMRRLITNLKRFQKWQNAKDVRIVFWYDN